MSLLTRREHAALTRDEAMNSRQISSRFRYLLFVQAINTNRRPKKTERRPLSSTARVIRIGPVSLSRAIIDTCRLLWWGPQLAWLSRTFYALPEPCSEHLPFQPTKSKYGFNCTISPASGLKFVDQILQASGVIQSSPANCTALLSIEYL
jgi:hypothetical protein